MIEDDCTFNIDERIKYVNCKSGDVSGTLVFRGVNVKGSRTRLQVSWFYPGRTEIAALCEIQRQITEITEK